MRSKGSLRKSSTIMNMSGVFLILTFSVYLAILQPSGAYAQNATIVYPGWGSDGKGLVRDAGILNPDAQAVIVVTKDHINVYKNQWQGDANPDYSFKSQEEAKSILSLLKGQGIQNVIINVDMDIGLGKYILLRGDKEIKWATSKGIEWSQAFRSIYKDGVIGSLSHSFGNAPAANVIENSKIDYAIMASPQAKRESLNRISEQTKLLVITTKGDIGPATWDGPTKFNYVILHKTAVPHNSMVDWNNLHDSDFFKEKVQSIKTNIKVEWARPDNPTLGEVWTKFYTVPSYWVTPDPSRTGKSMSESQTLTETVHGKNKVLVVGKGPEADLMYKNMVDKLGETYVKRIDSYADSKAIQLEARKFGADVILGVRDTKPSEATGHSSDRFSGKEAGGVFVSPQPENVGKGGSELRDEVLKSKPSGDSLSWPIKIPAKEK